MRLRPVHQSAAIPLRGGRVCLITSRSGRRWVIPKGRIEPGHTPAEAALTESWEEAGLAGTLVGGPIGNYSYKKYGQPHRVTVFVLAVSEEHGDWPERRSRTREWVTVETAIQRIEEPGLRELVLVAARLASTV